MTPISTSTISQSGISTLDVLWAFYQSQPVSVRKAFRDRLEAQDRNDSPEQLLWKHDLKQIRSLKDNWDGENAPRISRVAISHITKWISTVNVSVASLVRLYPTHLGAVMMKMETEKGRVNCEMGENLMSYFVKRPGQSTLHHSFEEPSSDNLAQLNTYLESLV